MDNETLRSYNSDASRYAELWATQPSPEDLYALFQRYFEPGPTVDIGCGSGREVAWLAAHGFDACGFDASDGLIGEARTRYPHLRFDKTTLPALEGVPRACFENVVCETVIMHLEPALIGAAVRNLLALLRPGGTLYLSWRVTAGASQRDSAGRLYSAFDAGTVRDAFCGDEEILLDREDLSASSGKIIHRIVVRSHVSKE